MGLQRGMSFERGGDACRTIGVKHLNESNLDMA